MNAKRRGRIRDELVLGLAAVVVVGSLATYGFVLFSFFRDFHSLVERNDVEIARNYAKSLGAQYETVGSWSGAEAFILANERAPFAAADAARDAAQDRKPPRRHPKDDGVPLVLLDARGATVYNGIFDRDGGRDDEAAARLKPSDGERVLAGGKVVGYVFFKSMVLRSYNPQEKAFVSSLTVSMGFSVGIGLLLALALGSLLAARFARPIGALDAAVRNIADGDLSARVAVRRRDEIGSLAGGFNRMADRLQATEAARQNLLADMAHELRTPVSIIQANLEMIIDGVYAPDPERMRTLYDETRILTGLISDLRAVSDLETGAHARTPEPVDLGELAEESRAKLAPELDARGMRMEIEAAPEARALADADRLRQVLRNILGNALAYAGSGSLITVAVERLPAADGGCGTVRTTVSDEGPGVPPEALDKIFDRFYRVDASRSRDSGGRGLGLAICRRIVESYGGTIGAENRVPAGLSVRFDLPEA